MSSKMKSKRGFWIAIHGIWVCDIDELHKWQKSRNQPTQFCVSPFRSLHGSHHSTTQPFGRWRWYPCLGMWKFLGRDSGVGKLVEATSSDQPQKYNKSHFGNHIIRVWLKTVTWSICRVGCIGSGSRIPRESCTFSTPYPKKTIPPLMNGHITWPHMECGHLTGKGHWMAFSYFLIDSVLLHCYARHH